MTADTQKLPPLTDAQMNTLAEGMVERLAAKVTAAEREEWQPIETAPRDGTVILAYGNKYYPQGIDAPKMAFTRWKTETRDEWVWLDDVTKQLVTIDESDWDSEGGISPTHWLPLPPPPQEAK